MALEANRQKETQTQGGSFLFQSVSVEFILFIFMRSLTKFKFQQTPKN